MFLFIKIFSGIKKHQEGASLIISACVQSNADVYDCFLEIAVDHTELGELLRYVSSSSVDIKSGAANVFRFSWQSLPLSSCVLHIGFVLWNCDRSRKLLYGKLLNTPYASAVMQVGSSLLNIQPSLSVSYS